MLVGQYPPPTNRGVLHTSNKPLKSCVDWVSVTFLTKNIFTQILPFLGLKKEDFEPLKYGRFRYKYGVRYNHIEIFWGSPEDNQGVMLNITGQGCREIEQIYNYEWSWSAFFSALMFEDCNITRLDIAIDDIIFKGKDHKHYLDYDKMSKKWLKEEIVSKVRTFTEIKSYNKKNSTGHTLYFGNNKTKFRFYEKHHERKNNGYELEENIISWQRYEMQLRDERAFQVAKIISFTDYELGKIIKSIMAEYFDFKVPSKSDSNKSRWETVNWWSKFLKDIEPLKLTQNNPEKNIRRSKNWLESQVSKTLAMVSKAYDDNEIVLEYILKLGSDKIQKNDMVKIQDFKNNVDINKELEYIKKETSKRSGSQSTTII